MIRWIILAILAALYLGGIAVNRATNQFMHCIAQADINRKC